MRELVRHTDVLICGSGFAQALAGVEDVCRAGKEILKLGPRTVVQTEGKEGSYTITPDECFHQPAFEVPVVDTTGAGDVFHGAYIVGIARGWDARATARFAAAVAALKCMHLGGRVGIPTYEQATEFLHQHSITR
jgi:sugar/nucleoside kinase (ribokinase family)